MKCTDKEIFLRPAEKADMPAVFALCDPFYPTKRSEEYHRWQWVNSVFPSVLMCGFVDQKLVGLFGIQKRVLNNGLNCGYATNLNIDVAWRKRGFFSLLGKAAINFFSDLDVFCVFANANARQPCEHSLGFTTVTAVRTMTIHVDQAVQSHDFVSSPLCADSIFDASVVASEKVRFSYSDAYRRWRYLEHPLYAYYLVRLPGRASAIVKLFTDKSSGVTIGDIVEIFCGNDEAGLRAVVTAATKCLAGMGANAVTVWVVPDITLCRVVENLGFRESDCQTFFQVKVLKPKFKYLYQSSEWFLQEVDHTNY